MEGEFPAEDENDAAWWVAYSDEESTEIDFEEVIAGKSTPLICCKSSLLNSNNNATQSHPGACTGAFKGRVL